MAGSWISDANGVFQPVKALWVSDASGTFQPVKDLSVSDATGTFHNGLVSGFAGGATLGLTAVPSTVSGHRYVDLTWASQGANTAYNVQGAGTEGSFLQTTATSGRIGPFAPSTDLYFTVAAYKPDGSYKRGAAVKVTTRPLPAPQGFIVKSMTFSNIHVAMLGVDGATGYQCVNADGRVFGQSTLAEFDLNPAFVIPNTYYDLAARALYNGQTSGLSNHAIVTTPAKPAPTLSGVFQFKAVSATTFQPNGGWRPDSDGLYHGNGRQWGSTRGNQSSWFFYGQDRFAALRGGRVVRCRINLFRSDDAGDNAATPYHWMLHPFAGRPSNPLASIGTQGDYGAFARGAGGFIDLPAEWGQALVNGQFQGLAMGNVDLRYMHHPSLANDGNGGLLELTLG